MTGHKIGARKKWNRAQTQKRKANIAKLINIVASLPDGITHGDRTMMAEVLGVSNTSITRYLREIREMSLCKCCGQPLPPSQKSENTPPPPSQKMSINTYIYENLSIFVYMYD